MDFIKLTADTIFDGYDFKENAVLIVHNDGTIEAIVPAADAGGDVQKLNGLLSPGFINCHCHLELSHMKGMIEEHTGLLKFVNQVVRQRNTHPEQIATAVEQAEATMLKNGIVAVGDICNTTDTLFQKAKHHLYYHNFIEVIGFEPAQAAENFQAYKKVYDDYLEVFAPPQLSVTPHAPYSVSTPLWKLLSDFPGNQLLSIHNQETPDEDEWFHSGNGGFKELYERLQLKEAPVAPSGKTSIQTYGAYLKKEQQLLFIHNVFTTPADIQYAKSRFQAAFWCLCPNANYYISNRLPDIPMLIEQQASLVLGTDSLASNYDLNIWSELLRIQKHFPQVTINQMLPWATINGARALKIDQQYGSFEKGKKPGVLQVVDNQITRFY